MGDRREVNGKHQAATRLAAKLSESRVDRHGIAHRKPNSGYIEGFCDVRDRSLISGGAEVLRVEDEAHSRDLWCRLLEDFDKFSGERNLVNHETGKIAARTRQAVHKPEPDRVGGCDEYHRNVTSRLARGI